MVEIEIGVLRGQCLDRRIGERDLLVSEIDARQRQRNASGAEQSEIDRLRFRPMVTQSFGAELGSVR